MTLLLEYGADVDAGNNNGETPLAVAEKDGHFEIVELLRQHGAKKQQAGGLARMTGFMLRAFLSIALLSTKLCTM